MFIKKKLKKNKGFTLIEMLIAVLIFSLSLASFMTITSKSLQTSKNSEEQLIADYLALEAIEVVHNLRDTAILNGLESSTWELVFQGGGDIVSDDEGCFNGPGNCNFYYEPGATQPVLDICTDCAMYLNKDNFYYSQIHEINGVTPAIGSKKTKYKRKIKIRESEDQGQVIVIVTVDWGEGRVVYTENLYLWQ